MATIKVTPFTSYNSNSITNVHQSVYSTQGMLTDEWKYDEEKTKARAEALDGLFNQLNPLRNKYKFSQKDYDKFTELKNKFEAVISQAINHLSICHQKNEDGALKKS